MIIHYSYKYFSMGSKSLCSLPVRQLLLSLCIKYLGKFSDLTGLRLGKTELGSSIEKWLKPQRSKS